MTLQWPMRWMIVAFVVLLASGTSDRARAQSIDFERFDLAGSMFLDVPEVLLFSDVDGSGIDVRINAGTDNRIYDLLLFGGGPDTQALIDWPWPGSNPAGTTIGFDPPVKRVRLQAGDYGSDDDTPLALVAFDSTGVAVASDSSPWPIGASAPVETLSVRAYEIRTVVYSSGGLYAGSTFIDDIAFDRGIADSSLASGRPACVPDLALASGQWSIGIHRRLRFGTHGAPVAIDDHGTDRMVVLGTLLGLAFDRMRASDSPCMVASWPSIGDDLPRIGAHSSAPATGARAGRSGSAARAACAANEASSPVGMGDEGLARSHAASAPARGVRSQEVPRQ